MLVAAVAALSLASGAGPALAHGLGGRTDLPVPRWLFVYGAATALVVSFVALAALWKEPHLERLRSRAGRPGLLQRLLTDPTLEKVVRGLSLFAFLVVVTAAFGGDPRTSENIAPVFVYVWFWVGLPFAHAILGNLWATLSPWDTLARLAYVGEQPRFQYPRALGRWPATLALLGFVWMELVDPSGAAPLGLGVAIVVYTLFTLAGMAMFGRDTWNRNGEAFAVYFELLARISPLARDGEGRVIVRPVLGGLPSLRPQPGLVAFIVVLLGSTTFDGFSRSTAWTSRVGTLPRAGQILAGTAGILAIIGLVAVAYSLATGIAAAVADTDWHPMTVRFVHSLVPIAFAYVVAHYFSLLVLEGQTGLKLLSDPFGRGWDVFGTAGWAVNLALLSATAIWYVQVAAIVAGHIGAVVLAHDRSVATFGSAIALRTQYAMLAVMVLFTVVGLSILSGG